MAITDVRHAGKTLTLITEKRATVGNPTTEGETMSDNVTVKAGVAARELNVTTQTIRRYVELGLLQAIVTKGGHRMIYRDSLDKLKASRTQVAPNVTVIAAS